MNGSRTGFRRRGVIITVVAIALALASAATALAAGGGTYTGTSTVKVNGFTASHGFAVRVRGQKIVSLSLIASGNCGTLAAPTSAPLKLSVPIHANTFSSTIKLGISGASEGSIKLAGRFKGATVSGSFSGRLIESAAHSECAIIKQTFTAKR